MVAELKQNRMECGSDKRNFYRLDFWHTYLKLHAFNFSSVLRSSYFVAANRGFLLKKNNIWTVRENCGANFGARTHLILSTKRERNRRSILHFSKQFKQNSFSIKGQLHGYNPSKYTTCLR